MHHDNMQHNRLTLNDATQGGFPLTDSYSSPPYQDHTYQEQYARALQEPEAFWREQAQRIDWISPFTKVKNTSFDYPDVSIKWFEDGTLNASVNCLDRHLATRGDQLAMIWEGDSPGERREFTYHQLHQAVCGFANILRAEGVGKGDVVTLYMPMIPETAIAMLACARIGAIHSVVFAGFSPEALASRIQNGHSKLVVTADEGLRGGKTVALKQNVDAAIDLHHLESVQRVLVVRRTGNPIPWHNHRDRWYHELASEHSTQCPPEEMSAEDPLFTLYTSGSTGAPKGVVHTTGGYLVYANFTYQTAFGQRPGDIHWCTSDFGWITSHTYAVYGPLCAGSTTVIYEGVPNYPDFSRFWDIVERNQVNTLYTAPTAIRAMMAAGDHWVTRHDRSSLRLLGSAGEPINPQAWEWYHQVVGEGRCPVIDTWWQTETGGMMIAPLAGSTPLKPGSATLPLFGVRAALVDNEGNILEGEAEGNLVLLDSWPGQARTIHGDHERFVQTYFSTFKGMYFTGDGARRDQDGYYWITGRVDDVINVSGHRMGTAELESALIAHPKVAEAAVVGYPHPIKGQGIYVYVTLTQQEEANEELRGELVNWVRREIGPIAAPDIVQWAPGLPKTRSGKIMRRILRKIAAGELDGLGDTSTLADPLVVDDLIKLRPSQAA